MVVIIMILLAVAALFLIVVMFYDSNRFVTVRYQLSDKRIRTRTRLVLLADLHNKQYGKNNKKLVGAIDAEKPDLVLSAGDLMTSEKGVSMEPAQALVRALSEKYPFYYANGNHEYRIYNQPEDYGTMGERYRAFLEGLSVTQLENQNAALTERGIRIYGLDLPKRWYKKFKTPYMEKKDLEQMLGSCTEDEYSILLAHNPVYFDAYAEWGADLTLSGHVHGGVMRLPFLGGVLSTAFTLFPKYDGGLFEKDGKRMIVSRGLGAHTIPIRIFNPAELVVIDLWPEE